MTLPRFALLAALLWPTWASSASRTGGRGCATALEMERRAALAPAPKRAGALSNRTLATAHFALHYSLAPGAHRAKLTAPDSALKRMVDSLLQSFPSSWAPERRDSALHASLDARAAPHPVYVQRAGTYFESARAYYVDTLGMPAPSTAAPSLVYRSGAMSGRFPVDIADIGRATGFVGEYYGLTYPPPVSIVLENDFLWDVEVDSLGNVTGRPVHSEMLGQVLHYYDQDWDLGLKVTAMHEFYHGVQFSYTPGVTQYHAWYELSAVGMEERLAPEVDDYFQYLPCVLRNPERVSLLSSNPGPCTHSPEYGHGIFFQFLTAELGPRFDVDVWSQLRALSGSGVTAASKLRQALLETMRQRGNSWDSLYARYAASLAVAGQANPGALAFAQDMPRWPTPSFESLPGSGASATFDISPLTFRLLRPPPLASAGGAWAHLAGLNPASKVENLGASGFRATALPGNRFPLAVVSDSAVFRIAASNSSFDVTGNFRLSAENQGLLAFPNPAVLSPNALVYFSAPPGSGGNLQIVSESGKGVADLTAAAAESWIWNLKDPQGRAVPPGVYFFRVAGQPVKPLLLVPR